MLALGLAACALQQAPTPTPTALPDDIHIPPFARWPYQPFSREAAVQIALREWRAFGQPTAVPNTELPFNNERAEGLWQRVGEYWWLGMPMAALEQGFTGRHNQNGATFPAGQDASYAWSAAFVGYVMRMAGAGHRFPYSATHADYINAARQGRPGIALAAERPEAYAPQRGDLICMSRGRSTLRFDDLPTGVFASHCDIVVNVGSGVLEVVGGNVEDSVAMRRIPVTADGRLAAPDGMIVDPDHPWFVVVRVIYDS